MLGVKKIGSKRKDEDKNKHTNLAPAVQQAKQNFLQRLQVFMLLFDGYIILTL